MQAGGAHVRSAAARGEEQEEEAEAHQAALRQIVVRQDPFPGIAEDEAAEREFEQERHGQPEQADAEQLAFVAGANPADEETGDGEDDRHSGEEGDLPGAKIADARLEEHDARRPVNRFGEDDDQPDGQPAQKIARLFHGRLLIRPRRAV